MSDRVLLISDDAMALHDPGPGHPERPARWQAIHEMLESLNIASVTRAKPRAATRTQIERVHTAEYIDSIDLLRGRSARLDVDTAVSPHSVDAAYLATGATIEAVTAAMQGDTRAFALVRPPGHHAEVDRAMGFCLFNHVAIAAAHAISELGCKRVLIVDWDVHHGNGTQHIFEHRRDVLYFSSHQWPLFPGSGTADEIGRGEGTGFTVNAPLPAGLDDAGHVELYRRLLIPIADAYRPDFVLVSAGFDSHREDPLGGMMMTEAGFAALCAIVCDIANRHANGRLALTLEGGYALGALARNVKACIEVLAGAEAPPIGEARENNRHIIDGICAAHCAHWDV